VSRPHLESEEEFSAHITDGSKKVRLFLVKFHTKEGAGNSSWKYVYEWRHTCRVTNCIWEELNITNIRDCKWATKKHKGVCPFTNVVKDQIAKARSLGIKCVSLLDINFDSSSLAKLYQQRLLHLHVIVKKIKIFREIWATKVHTSGKN